MLSMRELPTLARALERRHGTADHASTSREFVVMTVDYVVSRTDRDRSTRPLRALLASHAAKR
jgi:hypothetical protein